MYGSEQYVVVQATKHVVDLAAALGKLHAFVHLSTAYSNCDRPRGSHVEERIYPLDPTLLGRSSPRSNPNLASGLHTPISDNCRCDGEMGQKGGDVCAKGGALKRCSGNRAMGIVGRKHAEGTPAKTLADTVDALAAELIRLSADEATARVSFLQ